MFYFLSNFCCICFIYMKDLKSFANLKRTDDISYFEKLIILVPEMSFKELNEQRLVCKDCCDKIDLMYKFRQRCLKSKDLLIQYITKLLSGNNVNREVSIDLSDIHEGIDDIKIESLDIKSENEDVTIPEQNELISDNFHEIENDSILLTSIKTEIDTPLILSNVEISYELFDMNETHTNENQYISTVMTVNNQCDDNISFDKESLEFLGFTPNEVSESVCTLLPEHENNSFEEMFTDHNQSIEEISQLSLFINDDTIKSESDIDIEEQELKASEEDLNLFNSFGNIDDSLELTDNTQANLSINECAISQKGNEERNDFENGFSTSQSVFSSQNFLDQDETLQPDAVVYECNKCEQTFFTQNILNEHQHVHYKRSYFCKVCQTEFFGSKDVRQHAVMHNDNKLLSCHLCEKRYSTLNGIRAHIRLHILDKLFVCNICKKGFKTNELLSRHKVRHFKIKSFVCDICFKKFLGKYTLRRHVLKIHPS